MDRATLTSAVKQSSARAYPSLPQRRTQRYQGVDTHHFERPAGGRTISDDNELSSQ